MPMRAWLSFCFIAIAVMGCHFNASEQTNELSTQVPKGYAAATSTPKPESWEEKVQNAMKMGVEAQAQAAEKPMAIATPTKLAKVQAPAARHAKRTLSRVTKHKGTNHKSSNSKKSWYHKVLG
jgi:hypothetical protein